MSLQDTFGWPIQQTLHDLESTCGSRETGTACFTPLRTGIGKDVRQLVVRQVKKRSRLWLQFLTDIDHFTRKLNRRQSINAIPTTPPYRTFPCRFPDRPVRFNQGTENKIGIFTEFFTFLFLLSLYITIMYFYLY